MTISDSEGFWNGGVACTKCGRATINRGSKVCDNCLGIGNGEQRMDSAGNKVKPPISGAYERLMRSSSIFKDKTDEYEPTVLKSCQGAGVDMRIDDNNYGGISLPQILPTVVPDVVKVQQQVLKAHRQALEGALDKQENVIQQKQSNPKDVIGSDKVPMSLVPPITEAYLAIGHLEGDLKYGRVNWRESGVRVSIYLDALKRHIGKFRDGEWEDPVTHVPHLANALACISIIIDAYHAGKLIDDRPKSIDAAGVIDGLSEVVKHLKTLHKGMKPIDYFIDGPEQRE